MTQHSTGPWNVSGAYTNAGDRIVTAANGYGIAQALAVADRKRSTPYNAPDDVRDANARLVAAAPLLLASLIEALPVLERAATEEARANSAPRGIKPTTVARERWEAAMAAVNAAAHK